MSGYFPFVKNAHQDDYVCSDCHAAGVKLFNAVGTLSRGDGNDGIENDGIEKLCVLCCRNRMNGNSILNNPSILCDFSEWHSRPSHVAIRSMFLIGFEFS